MILCIKWYCRTEYVSPGPRAPGRAISFLRVASHGELTGREQNSRAASREFAGEFAGRARRPAQRVASPEDRADCPGVPGTLPHGLFITVMRDQDFYHHLQSPGISDKIWEPDKLY